MAKWNASDYAKNSLGQYAWAISLLERLCMAPDDQVLDIGCGDGKVTAEIARQVPSGHVLGVDSSVEMVELARQTWSPAIPNVEFRVADAQAFHLPDAFDYAFSNSALHWVPDHPAVLRGVAASLKPGGRLAFSMGGRRRAAAVYNAIGELAQFERWGSFLSGVASPHHFCDAEEYKKWLPQAGLAPRRVERVPKSMRLAGKSGLEGWLRTTWVPYTDRIPTGQRSQFLEELAQRVQARCELDPNGEILLPMVNLEVEAKKVPV
jgi:trans-aconitate 2-methyltransferase